MRYVHFESLLGLLGFPGNCFGGYLVVDFESVALKCLDGYRGWSWKNLGVLKIGRSTFYRLVVGLPTS